MRYSSYSRGIIPRICLLLGFLSRGLFWEYSACFAFAGDSPLHVNHEKTTSFEEARYCRTKLGHDAALSMYQSLLRPDDLTAATRIASSPDTPKRHDAACPLNNEDSIRQLRELLLQSDYNNASVAKMFGVRTENLLANGPLFLKPPIAGSSMLSPLLGEAEPSSLQCLVTLFLLGISVPRKTMIESLPGGEQSVALLEELGLAFCCQIEKQLVVPYVHVFPLDVSVLSSGKPATLFLVTDLHPRVLSTTTVGTRNHGTVMYIGPDSLALVQHQLELQQLEQTVGAAAATLPRRILDVCTGSGIQALSTLMAMQSIDPKATALCVDCSERALHFTKFNAMLNDMGNRVDVVLGDLVSGKARDLGLDNYARASENDSLLVDDLVKDGLFDIMLANPPFIPVPPQEEDIAQRYGLFSSGGSDGEAVLGKIVELASRVLNPHNGVLAIVSEFMNPPTGDTSFSSSTVEHGEGTKNVQDDHKLLWRIQQWWVPSKISGPTACGILFTNQHSVGAELYASRRADTKDEYDVWMQHMCKLHITHVSPGLLFLRTKSKAGRDVASSNDSDHHLMLHHRLVPKSEFGSIWTPSNPNAVAFTKKEMNDLLY